MPSMNIFDNDAFSLETLTDAINNPPVGQRVPTVVDALFAGNEEGVTTTMISIERDNDALALVPDSPRGGVPKPDKTNRNDILSFRALHLPKSGNINADEVQNLRSFGKESDLETVFSYVNKKMLAASKKIQATNIYHRWGAITGVITDATGRVLENLFQRFGFEQEVVEIPFWDSGMDMGTYVRRAKRYTEDVIGQSGLILGGYLSFTGRDFYDAMVTHDSVKESFKFYQGGVNNVQDNRASGFSFQSTTWQEFYGNVGGQLFINPNEAYLVPMGVDGLFMTRYAPADYEDTVNTIGKPYYAYQEPGEMNKGRVWEVQSNPIHLCTKPNAIIKLVAQTTKP